MEPIRAQAPLRHDRLVALLNTLSNSSLTDFREHSARLHASFCVMDEAAAAAQQLDAMPIDCVEFDIASLSGTSQVKPLLVAMAGAVNRGLSLISDVLNTSSSSSSSNNISMSGSNDSNSESVMLLSHLPAVHCISTCCSACVVLLLEHRRRSSDDRRAAVDITVLARTSGWCTSSLSASSEAVLSCVLVC
jgi:hypothetical protein